MFDRSYDSRSACDTFIVDKSLVYLQSLKQVLDIILGNASKVRHFKLHRGSTLLNPQDMFLYVTSLKILNRIGRPTCFSNKRVN